jgi:hypothetical protein
LVIVTDAIRWPAAPCQPVTLAARSDARHVGVGCGVSDGRGVGTGVGTGVALGAGVGAAVWVVVAGEVEGEAGGVATTATGDDDAIGAGDDDASGAGWVAHAATHSAMASPSTNLGMETSA